jgi:hypothetical protein
MANSRMHQQDLDLDLVDNLALRGELETASVVPPESLFGPLQFYVKISLQPTFLGCLYNYFPLLAIGVISLAVGFATPIL